MNELVENDVITKAWNKVYNLAQKYEMTLEEFENHCKIQWYKENLTNYEIQLIWAYRIKQAIDRLKNDGKEWIARELYEDNRWIDKFDFKDVDKAIKHLDEVCKNVKEKYNVEYDEAWLKDYDDRLYEKLKNERKYKPSKDY